MSVLRKIPPLVTVILMLVVLLFIGTTLVKHFSAAARIHELKNTIQQQQAVFQEEGKR